MIKFYDTCALLNLQEDIFKNNDNIWISNITLKELEQIKNSATKDEATKYEARKLSRLLYKNRDKYNISMYDINFDKLITNYNLELNNDSKIIMSAYYVLSTYKTYEGKIEFITSDLNCYMIAKNSVGLEATYLEEDLADDYTGYKLIKMDNDELNNFYNIYLPTKQNKYELLTNQYLLIQFEDTIADKYKWAEDHYEKVNYIKTQSKMFGKISPKDDYQQAVLDSLATNKITMLRGAAGTGKTLLSFGYMFQQLEKGEIDKIIVFCNTVATKGSAKLGFYPGSRTEKLLDSQIGNLLTSKLGDRMMVEDLIDKGRLVLLPMSDIRGYDTTDMNAAIYISEAQNLDVELMRLALQRIGEDSICILDGDFSHQVDMSIYSGSHNGMRRVSEVFRGQPYYGEIELKNIYRSKIAKQAELM